MCIDVHKLASGSNLEVLGDWYGCATSTTRGIVMQFCDAIAETGLNNLHIKWPDARRMANIATTFEAVVHCARYAFDMESGCKKLSMVYMLEVLR